MRVALVAHALDQSTRGNYTTVMRWAAHARDVDLELLPPDPDRRLDPVPDVIHGYHALHGGVAAVALARRYDRPLVISLGGTDLLCIEGRDEGCEEIARVLSAADCVTGAFDTFGRILRDRGCGGVAYVTVPRAVDIPGPPRPRTPDGSIRVLLPSGLRQVKDPLLAIEMAAMLRERGLPLALRIVGPVLSDSYAARVHGRAAHVPGVSVGEIEHARMPDAYRAADVVWNTSRAEGGSNSLLEGLAHGCAVFARRVLGNREMIPAEFLFEPEDKDRIEAFHRALLAETAEARLVRARRGIEFLREHHDPELEAAALSRAWQTALNRR